MLHVVRAVSTYSSDSYVSFLDSFSCWEAITSFLGLLPCHRHVKVLGVFLPSEAGLCVSLQRSDTSLL